MILSLFLLPLSALVVAFYSQILKFFFFKITKKSEIFNSYDFLYGIFFLTFLSFFLNLFFPLKYFSLLIFVIGIIGFLFLIYKKKLILKFNIFSFLILIIIFLVISSNNDLMYDSKLYHYQIIKYNYENKIIFGLSNLDPRLGFLSSWQQFLSLFGFNTYLVSNFSIILYVFFFNIIFSKNFFILKTSRIFFSLIILFLLMYAFIHPKLNGTIFMSLGSPEADTICMLFLVLSIFIFLDNNKNSYLVIISIILCATSKLSYVGSGLIILYLLIADPNLIKNNRIILFVVSYGLIFLFKSFASTGCFLFPVLQTCFDTSWSMNIENLNNIKNILQNWAKDQPLRQLYKQPEMFMDYRWFYSWFFNYFLQTSFIQILLPIFITSFLFISFKIKKFTKLIKSKKFLIIFLTLIFTLIIWFQAPAIRYGYGGILSISILLFSIILVRFRFYLKNLIYNKNIFIFLFCLVLLKNYSGLNFMTNDRLTDLKNTNLLNFKKINFVLDKNLRKIEKIYISKSSGGFCFNLKEICVTEVDFINNFKILKEFRYKYIFFSII
jgi:hypothetical protein